MGTGRGPSGSGSASSFLAALRVTLALVAGLFASIAALQPAAAASNDRIQSTDGGPSNIAPPGDRITGWPSSPITVEPSGMGQDGLADPPVGPARSLRDVAEGALARPASARRGWRSFNDGTAELRRRREARGDKLRPHQTTNTIPYWTDTFTYHGLQYTYDMVGTDPRKGSATTVVPTVLIPLRLVFPDGQVFDASTDLIGGRTALQAIVASPIFQSYPFVLGGTDVGTTQYGDAFQRANFWSSVSTQAKSYHVLLRQPSVLPVQTIEVPAEAVSYYTNPDTGVVVTLVDSGFFADQERAIRTALNVSPRTLPITVWGPVMLSVVPGQPQTAAWHGAETARGGIRTYIGTSYGVWFGYEPLDVYSLSHEIVEWMDDPFVDNFSPGWDHPFLDPPAARCDSAFVGDLLEVADPVEIFSESVVALPAGDVTYHVTEAVFLDFFTRRDRSRSVNGQYSMFEIGAPFGLPSAPSAPCTGHLEITPAFVDIPGATFSAVTAMNSRGTMVGFYQDASGQHAFLLNGSRLTTLDAPGDVASAAYDIDDAGRVVGAFVGASGLPHGFLYARGVRSTIDFPGSSDSVTQGINSSGDIVGTYDSTQPITHGFLLRKGKFQRIDTPFGAQSLATGINDQGVIVGNAWDDPAAPPPAFKLWNGNFTRFDFPGAVATLPQAITNRGDIAGTFQDPDGTIWGMATFRGYPYRLYAGAFSSDDDGHVFGYAYDAATGRYTGMVGTLPVVPNR